MSELYSNIRTSTNLNVLFPMGYFYPAQVGGPSNTIYWIAKALASNKINVTVVATAKGIKRGDVDIDIWKEFEGFDVIYHSYSFWQVPMKLLNSTIKKIDESHIVVLSSFFYLPSIIIAILAAFKAKPVIVSPRGEFAESALKFRTISKRARLMLMKAIFRSKINFHSTSAQETIDIKRIFPKSRVIEIPNFIELPSKLDLDVKDHFLFVGRLHPIKAIENIIRGLKLNKKFVDSNYVFKIAGDEPEEARGYRNKLELLVRELGLADKIIFLGSVTGEDKQKLMASSKFLFLLSNSENFGNVVVEALGQGTPVVASKGTPWASLELNNAGYWIENSPDEINKQVSKLLNLDEYQYMQMRSNALEFVQKNYDITKNILSWVSALDSIK